MSSAGSKDETLEGRIAAVAHLSAAYALLECADTACEENALEDNGNITAAGEALRAAADEIMEPCEIANVLQTVEEVIASQGFPATTNGRGYRVVRDGRAAIVRAFVDVRQAAKDDEAAYTPMHDPRDGNLPIDPED